MAIEKIIVQPYKRHQGQGDQVSFKGIALNPIEAECVKKINELIDDAATDAPN